MTFYRAPRGNIRRCKEYAKSPVYSESITSPFFAHPRIFQRIMTLSTPLITTRSFLVCCRELYHAIFASIAKYFSDLHEFIYASRNKRLLSSTGTVPNTLSVPNAYFFMHSLICNHRQHDILPTSSLRVMTPQS